MTYKTQDPERAKQNAHLKAHGYHWVKITQDWLDDNDDFDTVPGWHLYSPDNRDVSVAQALDEIERGRDVVLAEKKAEAKAAEQKAKLIRRLRLDIQASKDALKNAGEFAPQMDAFPAGERVLDTSNIMGSGDMFIIDNEEFEYIYYISIHGMDGDNWAANNIGGSGRGWRVPYSTELAKTLRRLRDELIAAGAHTKLSMFGGTMPATK
jgi:hypothetical protein